MNYIDLDFDEALARKFESGRRKHRGQSGGPEFVGDPLEELFCEMLDAIHYTVQLESKGVQLPGMRTTFKNIALMLQERRRELKRRI